MTRRSQTGLELFIVTLFCSGCGTVQNLTPAPPTADGEIQPPTRIYGGVRQDWTEIKALRFDDVYCTNVVVLPFYLADLPLSLIGDTLTLPYALGMEVHRSLGEYYFPKPLPEPDRASQNGNAFAPLAGNKLDWSKLSHRVEMPVAPKASVD